MCELFVYRASIRLPHGIDFEDWELLEVPEIADADVLIGMDMITKGDLAVTDFGNKTVISFRTPPVGEIDFQQDIEEVDNGDATC